MTRDQFFNQLWQDYIKMTPQALKIFELFKSSNPTVANDHVAFRTWDHEKINIKKLETHFFDLGYKRFSPYEFKEKKLSAFGYIHSTDLMAPKIFLSELKTKELSINSQKIINKITDQISENAFKNMSVFWQGLLWKPITWSEYQTLADESEYAAWLASIGLRVNHFTVSVNGLNNPKSIAGVIEKVEQAGFAINSSGGKIKGTPTDLLEQASTLADQIMVSFQDENSVEKIMKKVPSCYYEFALRYPDSSGQLYQGFVAASADKIFESTDRKN